MPPSSKTQQTTKTCNPPIAEFILRYRRSTGYVYRSGLLDFFDYLNGKRMRGFNATDEDLKRYESFAAEYLKDDRNFPNDIISYARHLDETGVVPKSAHTRIIAVKEFFSHNGIELETRTLKDIRRIQPKGGKRTNFEYIDKKILGEILHHVDARGKAFILMLASSGMRIGEALALNWSDLKIPDRNKYPDKPASIFIRTSKTGHSRTVYITRETEAALHEWKKVYSEYREFATTRSKNLKTPLVEKKNSDNRVFPFTRTSCYALWDTALKASGYFSKDDGTKRVQMNIHRLRNFFSVQMASATNTQVSEYLLGHFDKYGGAYTGRSQEQWEHDYMKAEANLTIGTTTQQIEATSKEVADLRNQVDFLTMQLEAIKAIDGKVDSREDLIKEIVLRLQQEVKK